MNDLSMSFHLNKNHNDFIIDLYKYLLETKECVYVKLIFYRDEFTKVDKDNINKILHNYSCKKLKESKFYLENIYDENYEEAASLLKDIGDNIKESFCECDVSSKSFIDSILVEGKIIDISFESLKELQSMNYNQIMFFISESNYDSLILGGYDYESLFTVSQINICSINKIKELYTNRYGSNLNIDK